MVIQSYFSSHSVVIFVLACCTCQGLVLCLELLLTILTHCHVILTVIRYLTVAFCYLVILAAFSCQLQIIKCEILIEVDCHRSAIMLLHYQSVLSIAHILNYVFCSHPVRLMSPALRRRVNCWVDCVYCLSLVVISCRFICVFVVFRVLSGR